MLGSEGMQKDVQKESRSLREILKPFTARIGLIEADDALLHAMHSEFIVLDGKKFYLEISTAQELKQANCSQCSKTSSGFAVALKPHEAFPDKLLVAFQCDSCKLIQLIDFTQALIDLKEKKGDFQNE